MITFSEFVLFEGPQGIHPELQSILDSDTAPHLKRTAFVKKVRKLGEASGVHDKWAAGSSRTVAFHKDPIKVKIDGQDTELPTVTKIAHTHKNQRGSLESYIPSYFDGNESLGTHQNQAESDYLMHKSYSVLRQGDRKGEFHHNPEGILPPLIDKDEENNHWMQTGHVADVDSKKFAELTKAPGFAKGLSHKKFHESLMHEWYTAHGRPPIMVPSKDHDKVVQHPFVQNVLSFCLDSATHPADFVKQNMGVWHNPVAKTDHLVLRDSGFTTHTADLYRKARMRKFASGR